MFYHHFIKNIASVKGKMIFFGQFITLNINFENYEMIIVCNCVLVITIQKIKVVFPQSPGCMKVARLNNIKTVKLDSPYLSPL